MSEDMDRPSKHGALLGHALALLATAGRQQPPIGSLPECCLTCAFREGCMTNQTAGTGKVALDCVLGIDPDNFACHHGMKDGNPKMLCVGYIAATLAPWSFTKEVLNKLKSDLDALGDGPDDIRVHFDAWYDAVDPERKLDVYQLARVYAARKGGIVLLEDGPCTHCGAVDRREAAHRCTLWVAPTRACHGEAS